MIDILVCYAALTNYYKPVTQISTDLLPYSCEDQKSKIGLTGFKSRWWHSLAPGPFSSSVFEARSGHFFSYLVILTWALLLPSLTFQDSHDYI